MEIAGEIEDNQRQLFVQCEGLMLKYLPTFAYDGDSEVRETERGQRKLFQYRFCISRRNLLKSRNELLKILII